MFYLLIFTSRLFSALSPYFTNSIFISPLLQSAVNDFSPFSFNVGKLQSPFLILQEIEKSSQPPIIEPLISPFFAVRLIVLPTFTRSHTTFPPFVSKLTVSLNDNAFIFIFSFVVVAENAVSKSLGTLILILRYFADAFVPTKSVHSLLNTNLTVNSLLSDTVMSRYSFSPSK